MGKCKDWAGNGLSTLGELPEVGVGCNREESLDFLNSETGQLGVCTKFHTRLSFNFHVCVCKLNPPGCC